MSQQRYHPPTPIVTPPKEALVEELVEEEGEKKGRLRRADVVLTHGKGNIISWFIRFFTRSYWNHAALVYVIRQPSEGYDNTFVIESEGHGVDVHNISKYLDNTKNDIAIKRLEADWFANTQQQPGGGVWYQRQVRGFALDEIDASYDFGQLIVIGLSTAGPHVLQALLLLLVAGAIFRWWLPEGMAWTAAGGWLLLLVGQLGELLLLALEGLLWLSRLGGRWILALGGLVWLGLLGSFWWLAAGSLLGQGGDLVQPMAVAGALWLLALGGLVALTGREAAESLAWERLLWPLAVGPSARRAASARHQVKRMFQDSLICSGFVQYAYYHAVHDALLRRGAALPGKVDLTEVCFNPELDRVDPNEAARWDDVLKATTPADLGRSRRLRWRYVVKNGCLWQIGVPPHLITQWQLTPEQVVEMEERQVEAIRSGAAAHPGVQQSQRLPPVSPRS